MYLFDHSTSLHWAVLVSRIVLPRWPPLTSGLAAVLVKRFLDSRENVMNQSLWRSGSAISWKCSRRQGQGEAKVRPFWPLSLEHKLHIVVHPRIKTNYSTSQTIFQNLKQIRNHKGLQGHISKEKLLPVKSADCPLFVHLASMPLAAYFDSSHSVIHHFYYFKFNVIIIFIELQMISCPFHSSQTLKVDFFIFYNLHFVGCLHIFNFS